MLLPRALLVPHWPMLLEDELRRHRTPMLEALALEARRFVAERPEIVVVLSGLWESSGPFHVGSGRFHRTRTDDPAFGVEARYDCTGHPELARGLIDAAHRAGVRVGPSERGVDAGVSVPLHFLAPTRGLRVVPLSTAPRPIEECRRWGTAIREVLSGRPERIGFVVGGMLSHATHDWNFRREVPQAQQLDQAVVGALRAGDWGAIGPAVDKWQAKAHPEAGLKHLEVLRGFLGADLPGEVLCYEAGPGMGAALVAFAVPEAISVAAPEALLPEPVVAAPVRRERRQYGERARNGARAAGAGRRPRPAVGRERPASARPRPGVGRERPASARPRPASGRPRPASARPRPAGRPDRPSYARPVRRERPASARSRPGAWRERPASARPPPASGRPRPAGKATGRRGTFADERAKRTGPKRGPSAGSRTPRPRGRAPASRPARRPRG